MNTVLITADALRADHLRQYGYERNTMPVLDRLLNEGTLFEAAYANGAHTQLSIPSILTGQYNGLSRLQSGRTVPSLLSDNDVTTAGIHSNPVIRNDFDRIPGFSSFHDLQRPTGTTGEDSESEDSLTCKYGKQLFNILAEYLGFLSKSDVAKNLYHRLRPNRWYHEPTLYESADVVTNRAIDVIEKIDEEPFFLWIHYMEPHRPYGYSPGKPRYGNVDPDYAEMIELMATAGVESDLSAEQQRQMIDLYDSDIKHMSDSIADLFDYLVEQEYWDETEIIFTADHGEEFGEHGKYYHRNKPYQELIQVPLLYRTLGRTGSRDPDPRQLVDLAPTIFETYSIDRPEWLDGKDLNSEYSGPIFGFSYRNSLSISVIEDDWKLIKTENGSDELYNLQEDPEETKSLAKERPGVVERLRSRIPARINRLRDDVEQIQNDDLSEETKEQLEDLGYMR